MDEGIDPTEMCQSLVARMTRSRQLSAVAHPEVLALFESWLEELEGEVIAQVKRTGSADPAEVAEGLSISRSGADFLIAKLSREDKLI